MGGRFIPALSPDLSSLFNRNGVSILLINEVVFPIIVTLYLTVQLIQGLPELSYFVIRIGFPSE
jgi:hypothetical protein